MLQVIPMESCIKPFLEGCDANNDGNIDIHEWGTCLGLKPGNPILFSFILFQAKYKNDARCKPEASRFLADHFRLSIELSNCRLLPSIPAPC